MKSSALFTLIILFCFSACGTFVREVGNGEMTTEAIDVSDFGEIVVHGNFKIYLEQGNEAALSITADENLHQYIEAETRGDRLEIETTEEIKSHKGIKLYITYTQLSVLEVGGAAEVSNEGVIEGDYLNLSMSGAGSVDLSVKQKALKISVSGAGAVDMAGEVEEQNVQMSGAGNYDAKDLISQNCKISISGVGSANVHAEQSLDAEVSGVGGITYYGSPKTIKKDVSGLGSIEAGG